MTDVERPRHRHSIYDSRRDHWRRFIHLHTFYGLPSVETQLVLKENEDGMEIMLDRAGRDRLIRELRRANDYEDLLRANPESKDL